MPVTSTPGSDGRSATLQISGRLDFKSNEEFRRSYEAFPKGTSFTVDLSRVEYLDSSALGMLLLLRRHAGDRPESVRLVNAPATVGRVLQIANFDKMFRIG